MVVYFGNQWFHNTRFETAIKIDGTAVKLTKPFDAIYFLGGESYWGMSGTTEFKERRMQGRMIQAGEIGYIDTSYGVITVIFEGVQVPLSKVIGQIKVVDVPKKKKVTVNA